MSLSTNLTSLYPLTSDVSDSQGNYDATNYGVTFANDAQLGDVAVFAGGDYFSIPSGLETGITTSYTMSMWIKMDSLPASGGSYALFTDHVTGSDYPSIQAHLYDDGRIHISHRQGDQAASQGDYTTGSVSAGVWTHLSFVFDGYDLKVYFNGALDTTLAVTYIPWNSPNPMQIGRNSTFSQYDFVGSMSDLRFWTDRALSDSEVSQVVAFGGLAGKWSFDTDGTDSVGSNDATVDGASFTDGHLVFDGSNDFATIPHDDAHGFSGDFSVSMWINTSTTAKACIWLKSQQEGGNNSNHSVFINQSSYAVGVPVYSFGHSGAVAYVDVAGTTAINDGNWHQVTITKSGSTVKMLVDGVLEGQTSSATGTFSATRDLEVGRWNHDSYADQFYFDGSLDDFRIWSRELSASEVTALYDAGAESAEDDGDGEDEGGSPTTIELTAFLSDSYGDAWNGGSITITDSGGSTVFSSTGPANGVKAPAGLTETFSVPAGTYTYSVTAGSYPSEIAITITDPEGTTLASLNGSSGTGTFEVVSIDPSVTVDQDSLEASVGDVMTATVNLQGGTLTYFAWEQYDSASDSWSAVAGGSDSVVDMTVAESMSEATMKVSMEVDGVFYYSSDMTMPALIAENGPMVIDGHWPTYNTQAGANADSLGDGSNHSHTLSGVTYYMPNGLPGGVGGGFQFHGDFPGTPIAFAGYHPLYHIEAAANAASPDGSGNHSHVLGGSTADYLDNMITELDFEDGMSGVTSHGSPTYSVQTINGQERKTIDVSAGQLTLDSMIADYVANRESTDQMTISFWFKHNGGDAWIVSDMFGIGGGVQSKFRLTLDGRFSSLVRINPGLGAMNEWYPATGGIQNNGVGMQGDPLSHGQWHHVSMVYDETLANGSDTGDITLYFDGVKTIGGFQRGWGGLGANGLDDLVNAAFFCIGGRGVNDQVFNGELSHFVVHGRALSEAEITELMGALPGAAAGTTYYMPNGLTMGVDQFHGDYDPDADPGDDAHDWTFDGQLSNIVKMIKGYDVSGDRSFMFLKNNDGDSHVYITSTLTDFSAYNLITAAEEGWSGAPVCGEHGPASCFAFGTSDGNLYKVSLSDYGVPDSSSLIHAFGAGSVNSVNYSPTTQEWIVEHDSKVYTIPYAGGAPSLRLTLPADSKVVDIAPGDDAIALTVQLADFTFARYFALIGWATIHDYTGMAAIVESIGATDFNYKYSIDLWVAAAADGTTVTTDDINNWLL